MHLSFQIKDHIILMRPTLEHSATRTQFNNSSRFIKMYIKKYYDLQVHSTLNFSFFITFTLNHAIFNLQLLVS